jgi:hypothetical protein
MEQTPVGGTMDSTDQVQRFMNECALFLTVMKFRGPLTDKQREIVKFKLYELVFEIESQDATSPLMDQASRENELPR